MIIFTGIYNQISRLAFKISEEFEANFAHKKKYFTNIN